MKKFITTADFADIFTTAVRTGGEGYFGVSLLAIERSMKGVKTRKMNMQGNFKILKKINLIYF